MVQVEPSDEERGAAQPRAGEVRFHGDRRSSPSFMPPRATARHPSVKMGDHDTLLSQSSTGWRFVVLLASICAYTLFILRPTVWHLQRKYFKTLPSVYDTRHDVANGTWRDGNIETNAKSYCEIDRHATRSNRVTRIRRAVELSDSTWEVSPFSFSVNATSHDNSDNEQIHVIIVIVESLSPREFASKFPRTNTKIRQMQLNRAFKASKFDINRVGGNSLPNRGALLLGTNSIRKQGPITTSERLGSRSLISAARQAGFKLTITETVQRPCQHHTNTLNLLVGECEKFKDIYHKVFTAAKCTPPEKSGKLCPRFPYPSKNLPTNCSGNSAHSIMISEVIANMRKAPKTLSILNFLDFHAPMLEYMSPDLDRSVRALIQELESYFDHFYLFVVGDHGHGLVSENGDAAGILLFRQSEHDTEFVAELENPPVTHFTLNKIIRRLLGGSCAAEEIPAKFCGKCRYRNALADDWDIHLEGSGDEIQSMSDKRQSAILTHGGESISAMLVREIHCDNGMMSDSYDARGVQLKFGVNNTDCSSFFLFDYGGGVLTSAAATSYKQFRECVASEIFAVLTTLHGRQVCISLRELKVFSKRSTEQCAQVNGNR